MYHFAPYASHGRQGNVDVENSAASGSCPSHAAELCLLSQARVWKSPRSHACLSGHHARHLDFQIPDMPRATAGSRGTSGSVLGSRAGRSSSVWLCSAVSWTRSSAPLGIARPSPWTDRCTFGIAFRKLIIRTLQTRLGHDGWSCFIRVASGKHSALVLEEFSFCCRLRDVHEAHGIRTRLTAGAGLL